ncbi:MAG: histidinol-phosphatase [Desulfobulbaceae bacterium]|uniref:Histidinol-phosphatase n=1 Tax=Candidatus Desulfobia pelagia TaxID=2841692 RepID=A0A8J6N8G6_9BACT|nr:histidinol-phosphatase [Candidatus Desulfobia pelagia]
MLLPSIDITTDHHVHTRLCNHAVGEMEEYVKAAVEKGLRKIVFLEHFEIGINYFESTWLTRDDFLFYQEEGQYLQEKYRKDIEVGIGAEVGYNPDHVDETLAFLQTFDWDWIGLSYHFLKTDGFYANLVSKRQINLEALGAIGVDQVITMYLQALLQAVDQIPANMLCHLDAVLRYHPKIHFSSQHYALFRELLEKMVKKRLALEVNTSGFPMRGEQFPTLSILKEAVSLGVSLVPGSDAHRPVDVGRHFDQLPSLVV